MHAWFAAALAVLGLAAGGALYEIAVRARRRDPPRVPPFHCGRCGRRLPAADLVSLPGLVLRQGRRRCCGAPVPPQRPAMEASAAVLFAWAGGHFGPANPEWAAGLLLAAVLIVVTYTDLSAMIIPNAVVFSGLALAVVLRAFHHPLPLWNYAAAAAGAFALLYAVALLSRGGMGGGDIKLYLFVGMLLGVEAALASLFAAAVLGAACGIAARAAGRLQKKQPIPFGPFIAAGAWLSFLYAERWFGGGFLFPG